jgi:membrane protein implicated in regulation of membrane protease activity
MDLWLLWLIVAMVLAVAEIFSLTAALGMLAVAALVTSGVAALGMPMPGQFVTFTVVSVAGVVLVRPWARRQVQQVSLERFGIDALVGSSARVLQEVNDHAGLVRIGGEEWTARPLDDSLVIPAGSTVDVMRISGSVAIVYPRE